MYLNTRRQTTASFRDAFFSRIHPLPHKNAMASIVPVQRCRSFRQSPIDVSTKTAIFDQALANCRFKFDYTARDLSTLIQDGDYWVIKTGDEAKSTFTATHLKGEYKLKEVRLHFGTDDNDSGSEHRVDGQGFAGEMQLMHWNADYGSYEEACAYHNGVVAITIFLKEDKCCNPVIGKLAEQIEENDFEIGGCTLADGFDLGMFLNIALADAEKEFWTYEGSLTTKPYYECATWIVFHSSASIANRQLDIFRSIQATPLIPQAALRRRCSIPEDILHPPNFMATPRRLLDKKRKSIADISCNLSMQKVSQVRPLQPVRGRIVLSSFYGGGRRSFYWDDQHE